MIAFTMKRRIKNKIREIVKTYVKEEYVEECVNAIYNLLMDYIKEIGILRSIVIFRNFKQLYNKIFKNVT